MFCFQYDSKASFNNIESNIFKDCQKMYEKRLEDFYEYTRLVAEETRVISLNEINNLKNSVIDYINELNFKHLEDDPKKPPI